MYLRKSNICSHQLDVQEANVSVPLFYGIIHHFVGCWTANDGVLALDVWDVVIEVLRSTSNTKTPSHPVSGNRCETDQLSHVDHVPMNARSSQGELYISEDNEAVSKIIINGRSPTMRHVPTELRLFDRINLDPNIQIKYVDTKNQFAENVDQRKLHAL